MRTRFTTRARSIRNISLRIGNHSPLLRTAPYELPKHTHKRTLSNYEDGFDELLIQEVSSSGLQSA